MKENRKAVLMVAALLFGMCAIPSIIGMGETVPILNNILYVGGSGSRNYTSIQNAIDNASDGDTVFVYDDSSPYYEHVFMDKSINLVGENKDTTIIDGSGNGTVIYVSADQVNITGFTITGGGNSSLPDQNSGIKLFDAYNCYIANNNVSSNNMFGIYLEYSLDNVFINNIVNNNNYGIYIYWSGGTIINNIVNNNNYGVYATHSSSNKITDNIINNNNYSIYLHYRSDSNTLTGNTVNNNEYGIHINYYCFNNILTNNTANSNAYGIYLSSSCYSNILTKNNITNNHYGLYIENLVNDNIFYHNNFINNTQSAYDKCINIWDDSYPSGGNYWDDYSGSDNYHGPGQNISGSDGIGDTPYTIAGENNQDNYPLMEPWSGDTTPPDITNIMLTTSDPLDTEPDFGWENVTCTVTGDIAVNQVKLVVTYPDTTTEDYHYPMSNIPGTDTYYYNTTFTQHGIYTYHVWAEDASDNEATSSPQPFDLPPNWDVNMNGETYIEDFVLVAGHYGETGQNGWIREDVSNNGEAYIEDFVLIVGHYGERWK